MTKERNYELIAKAISSIEEKSIPPLGEGGLSTVSELSRITGMQPRQIVKEIKSGGIFTNSGNEAALTVQNDNDLISALPSKKRDRISSGIWSEGQRYARRAQFPQR